MGRLKLDITDRVIYKEAIKGKVKISYSMFYKIISIMNQVAVDEILNGKVVKFPYNFGSILVTEKQKKIKRDENGDIIFNPALDYGATNKLRKELKPDWTNEDWKKLPLEERVFVYQKNYHTDGKYYKFNWVRERELAFVYKFKATRKAARKLASKIKDINDTTKYLKHDVFRKLYKTKHNITKST